MIVITTTSGPRAIVEIQPPSSGAVQAVKAIPRREWMPRLRRWSIPRRHVPLAITVFSQSGYLVSLDGKLQADAAQNPWPLVRASTDPYTWEKMARAIRDALDPDTALYRLLRDTYQTDRSARAS